MLLQNEYVATTLGALKASISVLLVLAYGFGLRTFNLFSPEGEHNMDTLSAKIFLPALLFAQIGPQASVENLQTFWPVIVLAIVFQALSLAVGLLGHRFLRLPNWIVAALVFNNATSLPLLLIQSLEKAGALDTLLWGPDDTVSAASSRAKSYILLNALVCNVTRFALGPRLMSSAKKENDDDEENGRGPERDPLLAYDYNTHVDEHAYDAQNPNVPPPSKVDRAESALSEYFSRLAHFLHPLKPAYDFVAKYVNPPLLGGALAVMFGVIPGVHEAFFGKDSSLQQTLTTSIQNVGDLYTVIQMLVLGSKLKSKKGAKVHLWPVLFVFLWRFGIMPVFSLGTVYYVRKWKPNIVRRDPILDFVLIMAPVGPPAITLAAIAEMASLKPGEDGKIARLLTLSYIVTPIISLPVALAVKISSIADGM